MKKTTFLKLWKKACQIPSVHDLVIVSVYGDVDTIYGDVRVLVYRARRSRGRGRG